MSFEDKLPEGWKFSKLRLELYCPHGVGHPIPASTRNVHGCCQEQCCNPDNGSDWQESLRVVEEELGLEDGETLTPGGF